ncbi:MAG: Anaerobic nitric oxide reductase transcription regulator NorR [candidate division WS2 bacterium]|nr:Anaerobic nitric oxide reductase transcription regulator NorR [Candidatus Lithacetigena glycinireducens]
MGENMNLDADTVSPKCHFCHELASTFAPVSSLTDTYNLIFDFLEKVIAYDSSTIFIKFTDKLQAVACRGFDPEEEKAVLNLSFGLDNLPYLDVMKKGGPVVVSDVTRFDYLQDKARIGKIRSWMGIPFFVNNNLVALLTVDKKEPNFYSEVDTIWLKSLAAFSAINIQRAYHYQELQKKFSEQEAMIRVSSSLIKSEPLNLYGYQREKN